MVKAHFYLNGFVVKGHANFAPYNQDLVCAGISAIVMGALNWFNPKLVTTHFADGLIELSFQEDNLQYIDYLNLIKLQLMALNQDKYLEVKTINQLMKAGN